MTVDECIKAYEKVGQAAFTPKRRVVSLPGSPKGAFSATALEGAIKQVVREHCPECVQNRTTCEHENLPFRGEAFTKTYVSEAGYLTSMSRVCVAKIQQCCSGHHEG